MSRPAATRRLGESTACALAVAAAEAAKVSPTPVRAAAAAMLGGLAYAALPSRRRTALTNLAAAFPGLPPSAIRRIARASFRNLVRDALDLIHYAARSRRVVEEYLRVEGLENLDEALSAGKGVVAVTAHLGPFTMIGAALTVRGYHFSYVFRFMSMRRLNRIVQDMCDKWDIGLIPAMPRREAAFGCLRALRRGEIVCILCDQYASDGIDVPFFGRGAKTATGAAVIAERTGAPVLAMFIRRENGRCVVSISPPIEAGGSDSTSERVREMTCLITAAIEREVARRPEAWFWLHRRWREG